MEVTFLVTGFGRRAALAEEGQNSNKKEGRKASCVCVFFWRQGGGELAKHTL